MAWYGVSGGGQNGGPAFTGFSGTLGELARTSGPGSITPTTTGRVIFNGVSQDDGRIGKIMRKQANQALRQLFISMIGANVGALASKSYKRVRAQSASVGAPLQPDGLNIGGLVPIDTVFYINRANTVLDDNNLSAIMNRISSPAVYPPDLSGATGGGKAGVAAGNIRNTGYF